MAKDPTFDPRAVSNLLKEAKSLLSCFEVEVRAHQHPGHATGCLRDLQSAVDRFEKNETATKDRIGMLKRMRADFPGLYLSDAIEYLTDTGWDYDKAVRLKKMDDVTVAYVKEIKS